MPLMASVPLCWPLGGEVRPEMVAPARSVRPSRAISGIGQLGSDSKAEVAILLPSAKLVTKPETRRAAERGTMLWGGAVLLPGRVSAHAGFRRDPEAASGVSCHALWAVVGKVAPAAFGRA